MEEKKAKQEDPFDTKAVRKQKTPKQLEYGKIDDDAEYLSIRKVMYHDEQNEEEAPASEKVRCLLSNAKWRSIGDEDEETPGITWLELYVYCAIHGGWMQGDYKKPQRKAARQSRNVAYSKCEV